MTANRQYLRARFPNVRRGCGAAVMVAFLAMTGCYNDVFDEGRVMEVTSGQSLDVQSEQVSFSREALNCAVDNGLFEAPSDAGSRVTGRLMDKGRALGFSDDVTVDEPDNPQPYTQVRGKFPVEFKQVVSIKDVEKGVKRVEARAGVKIPHDCFPAPLLLMGVHNGIIAQRNPAVFEFDQYGSDWRMMGVLH